MKTRRLALAAAATAAVIGLAGCGPKDDAAAGGTTVSDGGAPAKDADPQTRFSSAVAQLGDEPVKLQLDAMGGVKMSGAIDAKAKKAQLTTEMGETGAMEIRQNGNDIYVKGTGQFATLVAKTDKWMHVDTTTLPAGSALNPQNNDPKATAKMLAGAQVTSTGTDTFSGQVDMSKSPTINQAAAATLGNKLSAVPFTAKLDGNGKLAEITFDLASIAPAAGKMATRYSDYGTAVDITAPPASETVPMPETFRKSMGG